MNRISILLKTLLCWVSASLCWSVSAEEATYQNPVITGMNPDPSICRVGDDYYLVTSTFEYFPGLPIYHSKDLVNWKLIGHALSSPSSNPLMGCVSSYGGQYAPTLRYHEGMFYVIGTNYGGEGSRGDFYVTATDPAGPWSEPYWLDKWYVDPSLLFEDGKCYFLSPDNQGSFLLGELDPATGTFIKEPVEIAAGLGGSSPEGPHLYKINGYYYLMSAEGGTGYEHREVIQRSKDPYGPYEASPYNPVASNMDDPSNPFHAIGHADLFQAPDESWWLVCLGIRPKGGRFHHLGRETFLAPVNWTEDGWPKVGDDGIVRSEYPVPVQPMHEWDSMPVRDDFDSPKLGLDWNFLRNPHAADWSLQERSGYLRLNGSGVNFTQKDSPAFVCRRQADFNILASTRVEFEATSENEEAGLVVRGNDENHYDFVITSLEGKRVVKLRRILKGEVAETVVRPIGDGAIVLRISSTEHEYKFWAKEEDGSAELIGSAVTRDLSTEVIAGFTGTMIGMYASGNGARNANPADFDWFDYEEGVLPSYPWGD